MKRRLVVDNGLIVDVDTGLVLGVEYVGYVNASTVNTVNIFNALRIDRYSRSCYDRNLNRARAAVLMIASKYYKKRAYHALICFEKMKSKLDLSKDHVVYRKSGVIVWVSEEFAKLLVDVFKCAGLPRHILEDVLDYIRSCR